MLDYIQFIYRNNVACLATISKQHGYKTSITKIREVAGTDKQGTNVWGSKIK
ncbi:MAG TPA: hypothetical protein GXZ90_06385 [Clostridiales bacterium]|nr:hypothetical protein [Clostridiales bacterium]